MSTSLPWDKVKITGFKNRTHPRIPYGAPPGPGGIFTLWLHIWPCTDLLDPLSSPQTPSALPIPFCISEPDPQELTAYMSRTSSSSCSGELHLLTFLILVSLWHSKTSILPPPLWLTLFCCNVIPVVTRDQDHGLSTNLWAERAEKVKASNVNYLINIDLISTNCCEIGSLIENIRN